jgi:hypothetical protein
MTKEYANEIRLAANDIIIKLYYAGELGQLEILAQYSQMAVDRLKKEKDDKSE